MKRKKILITGASGFIGSHLTHALLNEGSDVSILVRYNSIEHCVRLCDIWDSLNKFECDIRNIDSLVQLKQKSFDYVFHLAAYNHVGKSFNHVSEAIETNCLGTTNLLETLTNYEKFLYVSTSEVYGFQKTISFIETQYPHPQSPYSVGKYAGELYSLMKQRQYNLPILVVRPFNVFGPYQSNRAIIPELIEKCLQNVPIDLTKGLQTREFNYINNVVEGMILAAKSKIIGEIINIGCGKDISIRNLANLIHRKTNSTSKLKFGSLETRSNEIWKMKSDSTKAKKMLNWSPKISFQQGLDITIKWYEKYLKTYYDINSELKCLLK